MGLFDRFRKKVKQAEEEVGITVDDGSAEAEEALQTREFLEAELRRTLDQTQEGNENGQATDQESEWDDFEAEEDPFQRPTSSKERKLAARDQAARTAERDKTAPKGGTMDSTTGRRLVKSELKFEIDLLDMKADLLDKEKALDINSEACEIS